MQDISVDALMEAMQLSHRYQYAGEPVSELEHALQCAELSATESTDEELVVAALLHDVGRFAVRQRFVLDTLDPQEMGEAKAAARGHNDAGANLLEPWFSKRVVWCVRMHVPAKRYLCSIDPSYVGNLSGTSTWTLNIQGGAMSPEEIRKFEAHRWFDGAIRLRRWDDRAKDPDMPTRSLSDWRALLSKYFANGCPKHHGH